ncbi:MAG: hypothetical protein L0Z50_39465, partial [Verrucomicrobiales bacterium]|nr:hypothetical protein [Verrucomicrobiales bacterium]
MALPRFTPRKCRFDAGPPGVSVSITLLLVFMAALLLPCGARAQQLYLQNLGGTELRVKDVAISAQGYSFMVGNAEAAGQGTLVVVETITGFVRAAQTFDFRPTTIAVAAGPDADNAYLFIGGNYNASNGNSRGRVWKYQYTQSSGLLTALVTYEVYGPSDGATPAADFQEVADLAVDGAGNVVILGRFKGSLSALGSTRTGETSNWQNFVLKLDGSLGNAGSVGWFQQWGLKSSAPARMSRTITVNSISFEDEFQCGTCPTDDAPGLVPIKDDWTFTYVINPNDYPPTPPSIFTTQIVEDITAT